MKRSAPRLSSESSGAWHRRITDRSKSSPASRDASMASPGERDEVDRSYRVELKETAEAEAEAAYLWMSQRSPEYAIRWYNGLLEAIAGLSFMPRRFAVAPESDAIDLHIGGQPRPIRQLRYGRGPNSWRVLFYIVE